MRDGGVAGQQGSLGGEAGEGRGGRVAGDLTVRVVLEDDEGDVVELRDGRGARGQRKGERREERELFQAPPPSSRKRFFQ
jgi:hypothetical protein